MPDEFRPLVVGPDGSISQSGSLPAATPSPSPSGTPAPTPSRPVFIKGSGDPVSDFIANMLNDMIINSPFYTPPSNPSSSASTGSPAATATPTATSTPAPSPTSTPAPSATPTPTFNEEFSDAYPDVDEMFDAVRRDFIRTAVESAEERLKEAKDKAKAGRGAGSNEPTREHVVGQCWCGKKHPDHVWGKCWCGKEGIHNVGTPH